MTDKREWIQFIEELKNRNDIVDVVSLYSAVVQKGRSYWTRCPIHNEKTPSMSINREGQFFKCFGCGVGGDVIKFVQDVENVSFMDAVEILAKRVNLPIPQTADTDKTIIEKKKKKDLCCEICSATAKFYYSNFVSSRGENARQYLFNRGIAKETATGFGIGLSTGYDELPQYLSSKGFKYDDCVMAGVLAKNSRGNYFDALAERLIVPIIDVNGNVIAFGGRILDKDSGFAKYKNTGNTPAFTKANNLFGLNLIKKFKQNPRVDYLIFVEGYMDVIALVQAGFNYTVASMGTSLTKEQAKLARRLTDKVYICYDGDSAGQGATLRGLDILKGEGLDVFVMTMPEQLDPDELIRKYGAVAYKQEMDKALPLIDYKLSLLKKSYPINSPNEITRQGARRNYASKAVEVLKSVTEIERESYFQQISSDTGLTVDFLKGQAVDNRQPIEDKKNTVVEKQLNFTDELCAFCYIASCYVYQKPFAVMDELPNYADEQEVNNVFDYIKDCLASNKKPQPSLLFDLTDNNEQLVTKILDYNFSTTAVDSKYFEDCVKVVTKKQVKYKLNLLTEQYKTCIGVSEKLALVAQIKELTDQYNKLSR